MHKSYAVLGILTLTFSCAMAQAPKRTTTKKGTAAQEKGAAPAQTGQPKYKAIWEPANYPKDINLLDVAFVSAEEGWVVGDKNTILHTKDGGKTWEAQLGGDPESSDPSLRDVFFLDAKHGWTRGEAEQLMRTTDGGGSWGAFGKISGHFRGLNFISPQTGFTVYGAAVQRTDDAGKTWKPVFQCGLELEVEGLKRKAGCLLRDLHFPNASAGYAAGDLTGPSQAGVVVRTQDAGATWTVSAPEAMERSVQQVFFWGPNTGLATMYGQKTVLTTDGQNWTGIVTPFGGEHACYAMGGGQLGVIIYYQQIAYSTNGGRSFSARQFPVPANVNAVTFPDARHGYLVGDHGMIYRYHIVPADYNVKGMIPAPMVGQ